MAWLRKKNPVKIYTGPVGGFLFFISLLSLVALSVLVCISLPALARQAQILPTLYLVLAALSGAAFAHFCIRNHISVFLHEFKHSFVSYCAGNKPKKLKVKKGSGYFTYEYSKETAHFNALIALAPYCVPLFTVPAIACAYLFWRNNPLITAAVAGFAYGIDIVLNLRDISPIQTDITQIRGGYYVGLTYIAAMNVTLAVLVLAWAIDGPAGILALGKNVLVIVRAVTG